MIPCYLPNSLLIYLCGQGMGYPGPSIRKALNELRKGDLVRNDPKHKNEQRWISLRWVDKSGAPMETLQMAQSMREHLPSRRSCITQKVHVNGQSVHYSIGLYPDGRPGELFIDIAKAGAALRNWAGEAGMMLSIALQHGTPLSTVLNLFIGTRCDPSGKVEGHPRIKTCLSIMDLIARDMAITFLKREDLADMEEWNGAEAVPISEHYLRTSLPDPLTCTCHSEQ